MKNLIVIAVMFCAMLFWNSCASKKGVSNKKEMAIELNPCEEYALAKPAQRAYGVGEHFKESTAMNIAELQARAKLARALQTMITTATDEYAGGTTLFSADDSAGASITDQSSKLDDKASAIAKEMIRGAAVSKVSKFKTENNQYKIYVCVEYAEDVANIAGKVTKAFSEKLTKEQKEKVKFDEFLYEQKMKEALEGYKGMTE